MAVQDGLALNEALKSAEGDINLALKMFNDSRWQEVSDFQFLEKVRGSYGTVLFKSDDNRSLVQRC